jgi:hypothetical protein
MVCPVYPVYPVSTVLVLTRTSVGRPKVEWKTPPVTGTTWGRGKGSTGKRGNPRVSI